MKSYKVIKEWDVQDENLSYNGLHAVGDIVSIPDDHAAAIVNAGFVVEMADEVPAENTEVEKSVDAAEPEVPVEEPKEEEEKKEGEEVASSDKETEY